MMDWIDLLVGKHPKVNENILICTNKGGVCSGYLARIRPYPEWVLHDQDYSNELVIAWKPLPKPLKYSLDIKTSDK